MFNQFMQKFNHWLSDKPDEPDEQPSPTPSAKPPKYTPKTLADFIDVLKRTPKSVISDRDRTRIAAIMSFDDRKVQDLMVEKSNMVFVKKDEILGPLVLDKLYKSGFTHFPVVDSKNKVKGIIHTEALNALEIKKTDRADKYLDKDFNYLHASDSLPHAVEEITRTGSYYFLVLDSTDSLAGFFTVEILLNYLLGH